MAGSGQPETGQSAEKASSIHRLAAVTFDEDSIGRGNPDQEHERAIAIFDILEENHFSIPGREGPYALTLGLVENKLSFAIRREDGEPVMTHLLSLTPFRRVIRDYEMICESYYNAIKTASPTQIEAIDMGRRGLHNEASELLRQRLEGKVDLDHDTARRLFTLVFALHWKA
ncbi:MULTISPECIES: UPF0262 family protein [Methylobacterium]|jgi:uncharacterized protein (UPF0262 family)|uniref:UPF0262 protein MBLL_01023 n=1 Tax=Methylobacterium bullatum TaxID=570505 RepID=A0A679JNK9_9HYPH|nr:MULTISPECIES: UPF0262 family protein [unclassified Methylobacterium]KQO43205.1 hypothetical protein ASF08_11685 [Methylobacterium sp. Leaf85]CAA2138194.1 hypothetical protein MBLL_01023 [Methylobacterium bullatum]